MDWLNFSGFIYPDAAGPVYSFQPAKLPAKSSGRLFYPRFTVRFTNDQHFTAGDADIGQYTSPAPVYQFTW